MRRRMARASRIVKNVIGYGMRVMGPVLVLLGAAIIATVVYVHFTVILPYHVRDAGLGWLLFHLALDALLMTKIAAHYTLAVFTAPGQPKEDDLTPEEVDELRQWGMDGWCNKCNLPKPARTHHCSYCNRCVLAFDHHCPWIANCVGFHNYKHFVFFVASTWAGCLYIVLMSLPAMMSSPSELWGPGEERTHVIFCFIIGIALLVALGVLLIWHIYLSMTAQTTVEFYLNTRFDDQTSQNLFDLGSWRKNVIMAFGDPGWMGSCWIFHPLGGGPRPGDGITWRIQPTLGHFL